MISAACLLSAINQETQMSESNREIPFIKDIMSLRLKSKADVSFDAELRSAIFGVCQKHNINITREAIDALVFVQREEVASAEAVGTLPVGSQCGF